MDSTVFCQGCLTTKQLVLFTSSDDRSYQNTFEVCFNLKVGFNSKQLEWICKECIENLNSAMKFRQCVEETQKYLTKHFSERYKIFDSALQVKQEDIKPFDFEIDCDMQLSDDIKEEKDNKIFVIHSKKKKQIKEKIVKNQQLQKPKTRKWKPDEAMKLQKRKFKCKVCGEVFANEHLLAVHKINVHKAKANSPQLAVLLACTYCSFAFSDLYEMNNHLVAQHGCAQQKVSWETRNYVPCTICGFYFRDFSVRSYHVRTVHKLYVPHDMLEKCTECHETFISRQHQLVHLYNTHKKRLNLPQGGLTLTCEICDTDFMVGVKYKRHMKEFHNIENGLKYTKNKCKYCGIYFETLPDWRNHLCDHGDFKKLNDSMPTNTTPKQYNYKCRKCPLKFPMKSLRRKHMEEVHDFRDTLPCEVCGRELSSLTALRKHLKTHTREITAICDYCGYGTSDKFDLITHFPKHFDKKLFRCHICLKEFKTQGQLRQHLKIHFDKQFSCNICGMQFTHRANMRSHKARNHKETCITDTSMGPKSCIV